MGGSLLLGVHQDPTQSPVLQYLEWMPSTNGPPRPFSWSTSWRSFSISSDRRPCARQTRGWEEGAGRDREGREGQRGWQSWGKAAEGTAKCKARAQARPTDHTKETQSK